MFPRGNHQRNGSAVGDFPVTVLTVEEVDNSGAIVLGSTIIVNQPIAGHSPGGGYPGDAVPYPCGIGSCARSPGLTG